MGATSRQRKLGEVQAGSGWFTTAPLAQVPFYNDSGTVFATGCIKVEDQTPGSLSTRSERVAPKNVPLARLYLVFAFFLVDGCCAWGAAFLLTRAVIGSFVAASPFFAARLPAFLAGFDADDFLAALAAAVPARAKR